MGSGGTALTNPNFEFVEETGSTNSDLLDRLSKAEQLGEGYWLRAGRQLGGRGRLGRQWQSPQGNLYCSTIVQLRSDDPPAHSLSFVTGVAVYDSLAVQLGSDTDGLWLKWPNDILWQGAKLAGMLLERVNDTVVVGIGVNVAFAPVIADRDTTSIQKINDAPPSSPAEVLECLAPLFQQRLKRWRELGLRDTLDQWMERAHRVGTVLSVSDGAYEGLSGAFDGLGPDGSLRLRLADGDTKAINAGEITIISA
ncbi:biotin--[acetyl-CoA-carboxylase] ligase [Sphingomonas lacunae]|uniref:Biotin--[acetyl-CoA-carboxylase] ligase n=1 Tax=Sphingomonas lacunae TaxID=2698828 RepID=A0A6M4AV43_9SPHN|nr:biotin--[acetyl-CoA-carboxylase] ligase [Sphingomonas lacunae]QJQ32914.1 biotin--[acetyl-CoA-carboxylase] ligase [Sphingomonas lacunae]